MTTAFTAACNLIQPYVTGADGETLGEYSFLSDYNDFALSLSELTNHASSRFTAADDYTP
ncbi:MAG: hypothetical protein MK066_13315 [Crocinitomicaceae bacterium]|nr:hypothetical protein [Crocinitomicaceae bacterium]